MGTTSRYSASALLRTVLLGVRRTVNLRERVHGGIALMAARLVLFGLIGSAWVCLFVSVSRAAVPEAGESAATAEVPLSLASGFAESAAPATAAQLEADAASRTLYEGLGKGEAVSLAARTFRIAQPVWQQPGAAGEGKITGYVNNFAAVEKTPGGRSVVVYSTVPLRVNDGTGLAPTSFALKDEGETLLPENPVVPVAISKHASGGITFPEGLQVTPVGASEPEAPAVVGERVVFANVVRDTDLISEASPAGAEMSWQLRSQASPVDERLLFHLPAGVVLQTSSSVPGGAEVVVEGRRVMLVEPAVAQDAEGHSVPVSYVVEGTTLDVHVDLSGPVRFPVLVDPTFSGEYGFGGSESWSKWTNNEGGEGCSPQCFSFSSTPTLLKVEAHSSAPFGPKGAWGVAAPGYVGQPGSAGITRVDVAGVIHKHGGQSRLIGTIEESNGKNPVYSWNGTLGANGPLPLYEGAELNGAAIAFCAQTGGTGGHDGGNPPLCDEENDQGHSFVFEDEVFATQSETNYVSIASAKVVFRDVTAPNRVELIHPGNDREWFKTPPSGYKVFAEDEGLGIKKVMIEAPYGKGTVFNEEINCTEVHGFHGCPSTWESASVNLGPLSERPSGEYSLTPLASDAAGNVEANKTPVPLFLDHTGPVIAFSGPLAEAAGGHVGEGSYLLHFTATDGTAGSPATIQSGTRSLEVTIDGRLVYSSSSTCPKPEGPPAEGCYALAGSWTMGAQSYGVGTHTIVVTAKDWVGNESTKTLTITVNGAAYEPLGPGSVNLNSGDFKLNATDVAVSGGSGASLSVSRSYDSRNPSHSAEGPLGPGWTLSLPDQAAADWQSLTAISGGNVESDHRDGRPGDLHSRPG